MVSRGTLKQLGGMFVAGLMIAGMRHWWEASHSAARVDAVMDRVDAAMSATYEPLPGETPSDVAVKVARLMNAIDARDCPGDFVSAFEKFKVATVEACREQYMQQNKRPEEGDRMRQDHAIRAMVEAGDLLKQVAARYGRDRR